MTDRARGTQALLTRATCPVCESKSLDLRLSCRPDHDTGLHTAACRNCGIPFSVATETGRGPVEDLIRYPGCPECGHTGVGFAVVCESPSRSRFRIVACESCGHPVAAAFAGRERQEPRTVR